MLSPAESAAEALSGAKDLHGSTGQAFTLNHIADAVQRLSRNICSDAKVYCLGTKAWMIPSHCTLVSCLDNNTNINKSAFWLMMS